jgi:pimeloyl-ACP methyl ester carboxylesterase
MTLPRKTTFDRRDFLRSAALALAATQFGFPGAAQAHSSDPLTPSPDKGAAMSQTTTADAPTTVVLVHGAFADSSSWNGVISRLLAQGYPVVAAANPLRGLKADAEYLEAILASIPGPVVLVGHSYGGAVITNAASGNANVVGLVYVAAFAPDQGETNGELTSRLPGSTLGPTQTPPVALPDGGAEVSIQQDKFWQQFAADIPEADAKLAAATQRPVALAGFTDVSGPPAWKAIPSRFIYGDQDKNIPPALMSFMAQRAQSQETIEIKGASHVVMISHPDEVAEMIHQSLVAHTTAGAVA